MAKKYFIKNGGGNLGPFPMLTIIEKVAAHELSETDKIYNEEEDSWMMISQHPEYSVKPKVEASAKPTTEPLPMTNDPVVEPQSAQWYVLKAQNRFGPFPYLDLVKMLQDKSVFEFDYIWRQGLATWTRIAEVSDFSYEKIRSLMDQKEVQKEEIFYRRKHGRWPFETNLIVHDNNSLWKGKTVELSEGGAGVVMENAMLLPGQNVYIHFKAGTNLRSFNVLCEVVSKKYDRGVRNKDTPIVYGLKFINILKQDREIIRSIFEKAA